MLHPSERPSERPVTIVAIDDDPRALELVQDVFCTEPDVSVVTASDAASGFAAVRRWRPGIVLLDLVIPGADGMSVLDDIIRFSPETALPKNMPRVSFSVTGDGGNVIVHGQLTFPEPLPIQLEPWHIPM